MTGFIFVFIRRMIGIWVLQQTDRREDDVVAWGQVKKKNHITLVHQTIRISNSAPMIPLLIHNSISGVTTVKIHIATPISMRKSTIQVIYQGFLLLKRSYICEAEKLQRQLKLIWLWKEEFSVICVKQHASRLSSAGSLDRVAAGGGPHPHRHNSEQPSNSSFSRPFSTSLASSSWTFTSSEKTPSESRTATLTSY